MSFGVDPSRLGPDSWLVTVQGTAPKFFSFLLTLIVESYSAAGLGMAVGCLVPSVDAGLAVAPAVMLLFLVLGGFFVNQAVRQTTPMTVAWPAAAASRAAYSLPDLLPLARCCCFFLLCAVGACRVPLAEGHQPDQVRLRGPVHQ